METISLPSSNWFFQSDGANYITNVYTGSYGTHPYEGSFKKKTFYYKVYIDIIDSDTIYIVAECFLQHPWTENLKKTNYNTHRIFFSGESGIQKITNWLEKKIAETF